MTILVTGGNGQLGSALRLASAKSSHRYIFTDIDELDITSAEVVNEFVQKNSIDIVVNCAAYTAVDRAESDETTADKINHKAVATLAAVCARHNAALIHISTDYIFSGEATAPITEEATPAPINAYGRTKWAGEEVIAESGCRAIILRTSWLYSEFGTNFCKTMRTLTASRPEIKVVADQFGTPTYAGDLAEAIVAIIESGQIDKSGTYNYSNEGVCSWYDFAQEIATAMRHDKCKIHPCHSNEFPSKVTRPPFSVLDKTKIKKTFGIDIPHWRESMIYCLKRIIMQQQAN